MPVDDVEEALADGGAARPPLGSAPRAPGRSPSAPGTSPLKECANNLILNLREIARLLLVVEFFM